MKTIKLIIGAILILILLVSGSFIIVKKKIEKSLIEICDAASLKYDCLPRKALVLQLGDETINVETMNETIWAIGKMKMKSTLPKLEQMYTACNNETYEFYGCKRELEKAIGYMKYDKADVMSFDDLYN